MPRFRLPRISIASLRDRAPSDERLMLIAQIAGFVVLIGVIATFVLIASANAGEGMAVKQPPVPTITNAGEPAPTTTSAEPAPPPVTELAPPTVASQEAVVKPAPKPKPQPKPKPKPTPAPPPTTNPPPDPGPGDPQAADPWDHCAPEGAHAFTKHRHIPLVCQDGRWHFADFGGR